MLLATAYGKSRKGKDIQNAMNPTKDKLLTSVSTLMRGWLYKRGNWNKNWKKRWFVMRNDNNLYYYERKDLKHSDFRGIIALSNIRKIAVAATDGCTPHSFDIQTSNRRYHFSCHDDGDLKDWMGVLECLMNNPLESIAPAKAEKVRPLACNRGMPRRRSTNVQIPTPEPDPDRFKHRQSYSDAFHQITVTTPETPSRHKRGDSMFDVFKRGAAKLTKRDSDKQSRSPSTASGSTPRMRSSSPRVRSSSKSSHHVAAHSAKW